MQQTKQVSVCVPQICVECTDGFKRHKFRNWMVQVWHQSDWPAITVECHSLGNASHEPGSSYDAHARPAALYAPSWHDASPRDGPRSDAPWCPASWPDDAWTDAWANAPAGSVCAPTSNRTCCLFFNKKWSHFILVVSFWPQLTFILTGCRKSSQSHPLPHQPSRGDKRTHALHALQPVSTNSFSAFEIVFCFSVDGCWTWLYCVYSGSPGSRRCVWSLVGTTSLLWSLTMRFRLVLHEMHYKALRLHKQTPWRSHSLRNKASQGQFFLHACTHVFDIQQWPEPRNVFNELTLADHCSTCGLFFSRTCKYTFFAASCRCFLMSHWQNSWHRTMVR